MTDQRSHPTGPDHAGEESMAIGPPPPGGDEGEAAAESLLTGEEAHPAQHPDQQAGQDPSLRQRLRDPGAAALPGAGGRAVLHRAGGPRP